MANFENLRETITEVIKQNGNEEITGDVLQYVLLEMVTALGSGQRFMGVITPQSEPEESDGACFYIGAQGQYRNLTGIEADVTEGQIGIFTWDGAWTVLTVQVTRPVDDTLTQNGQNPVESGAIYAEFEKLRAAGYLFAGLAVTATEPPSNLTEKIFYIASQGGIYANFGTGITLPNGINIIRYDGSVWRGETLWEVTGNVESGNANIITSGGVYEALLGKQDKEAGKGLSEEDFTSAEKEKLTHLPTSAQLLELLGQKQNTLTFDQAPVAGSNNPVTSNGIHEAIKDFITKAASDLINYYTKSDTYSKTEVNALLAAIKQFRYELVPELPEASIDTMGVIYFVPSGDPQKTNIKDEYITLTRSEGGSTVYYWEQIGSTAIDLSGYSTTEQMNAAIALALQDYYLKMEVDTLIAAAVGTVAEIEMTASKDVVLVGEATSVYVVVTPSVNASSIILKRNGTTVAQGAGASLPFSDILTAAEAGDVTYMAILTIGGIERTAEVIVKAVDPVYYGAGADESDIVTTATARLTPAGRYQVTAVDGDNIFILVPFSMEVLFATMGGLEIPFDTVSGVVVGGKPYKCYKSSNVYEAGTYYINVY